MERNPRVLGRHAVRHARERHVCLECQTHQARFTSRFFRQGVVRADAHHTLCPRCFRSARDQAQALLMARGRYWAAARPS